MTAEILRLIIVIFAVFCYHSCLFVRGFLQALDHEREHAEVVNDPLEKQEMLARCRLELKAIQQSSANIKDLSSKLDIVVGFLSSISDQLLTMNSKLDAVQSAIKKMGEDLKQLVARPVLEVIEEWSRHELITLRNSLPSSVYIENSVIGAGDDHNFLIGSRNQPKTVKAAVHDFFTGIKNILLLSGAAGSGKSTVLSQMKSYVLEEYAAERAKEGIQVVLLFVSLPTLVNPYSDVFEEGAKLAYNKSLRPSQIIELREKVQAVGSKVCLTQYICFLLPVL
jgi:hypothetical protein